MRPFFPACLLVVGGLLTTSSAMASATFPSELASQLDLAKVPACTLCHTDNAGGIGTVTTPFGKYAMESGVQAGSKSSITGLVQRLLNDPNKHDGDGDGISDLDELKAGTDPNVPAGGTAPEQIEYGCASSSRPVSGAGGLAGLLVALGLVASRRR